MHVAPDLKVSSWKGRWVPRLQRAACELSIPSPPRAMAFRLATIQRQVLAGDSAVSGGLLPCRVSEDSDFEKRVQEMKTWMGPSAGHRAAFGGAFQGQRSVERDVLRQRPLQAHGAAIQGGGRGEAARRGASVKWVVSHDHA